MESHKTLHLLALVFSLVMIEKSMASRILLMDYPPPPPPDNDHSKIDPKKSTPRQDGIWNGNGSDQGTVMVPPPATQTKMKQAGNQTYAQVDVSAATSPTSATSSASVTRNSNSSSTTVTNGGTVTTYKSEGFSAKSSSSVTKYP
ncbi:hypothetical protein BT93_G0667 [Corymbia citriodora subsp. variegata]|nr:hypothetical protein BT93_G0667 [Corymbia citriodora subsp. variegata]